MHADDATTDDDAYPWEYADQGRVSIRMADAPVPDQVREFWEFEWHGMAFPRRWLVQRVESLTVGSDEFAIPHAIDVTDRRTEWGASGALFEVVLYMAAGGIVGGVAWDSMKALGREIALKLPSNKGVHADRAINEAEATERARWLIVGRYGEASHDLELVSSEVRPPDEAEVVMKSTRAGSTYTCTFVLQDGLVSLCRLLRTVD